MNNDHRERDAVDLDALRPVSLEEIAQGPNREWNRDAKAPELFTEWWKEARRSQMDSAKGSAGRVVRMCRIAWRI